MNTKADKIEFLKQGCNINHLIMSNTLEIDELEAMVKIAPTDETVMAIKKLKDTISQRILKLISVKEKINSVINELQDSKECIVLRLRYVNFYAWDDIATEICCSMRTVRRIYDAALEHLNI